MFHHSPLTVTIPLDLLLWILYIQLSIFVRNVSRRRPMHARVDKSVSITADETKENSSVREPCRDFSDLGIHDCALASLIAK